MRTRPGGLLERLIRAAMRPFAKARGGHARGSSLGRVADERVIGTISLDVTGLGIIMYSAFAVAHIAEGEDYFAPHYQDIADVLEHIYKGTIVGFCTGSPGRYILRFLEGYPRHRVSYEWYLRLGIEIRGGRLFARDVHDLEMWTATCPLEQSLEVDDGFYHITLASGHPPSGIIGDDQVIDVYLHRLRRMPRLKYRGVPLLYYQDVDERPRQ